jgi:hypothetical protein
VKLRKTRIRIETHRAVAVRRWGSPALVWQRWRGLRICPGGRPEWTARRGCQCASRQALSTELHFAKTRSGAVVVGIKSLSVPS